MSGHSKWANIKHRKGKMDALRGKVTTKVSREITIAVRMGGADPAGNMRLKLALQKAKENNIPKDNVQRAIQKGQGALEGSTYEEMSYEGYGPAGVAVMIDIMTDNRNRTAADIRHLFSKYGGNLGESGCVSWMFKKTSFFTVDMEDAQDEESLMMTALDAGAEDFRPGDGQFEILAAPEDFEQVQGGLEAAGVKVSSASITMLPQNTVAVSGEDAVRLLKLMDALEEHDDVQEVYANFDIPEDMME